MEAYLCMKDSRSAVLFVRYYSPKVERRSNEKKKTVKTRILSLFLILLLLTGSVSGVHAQEEADMGAAGNETTKEQIVESGDSSGSGEQGSVPESTESTDGSADVKKDEETSF